METVEIGIESPRALAGQRITGERVPVGVPGDYKPCIARLPDGRLLLVAFAPYQLEKGRHREEILLFRSGDGGATWSDAENLTTGHGLLGREPYFTVLRDGTVLMTVHFLAGDVRNPTGYTRSFVHRSTDGGRTWSTTVAEPEGMAPGGASCTTRTVLELDDGSLLLGVGSTGTPYLWRSRDGGETWPERHATVIEELGDDYPFPFLGEAVWWQAPSGRILVLARLDTAHAGRFAVEVDDPDGRSDNVDRLILYASDDQGRSFRPLEALGRPGEMYPAILQAARRAAAAHLHRAGAAAAARRARGGGPRDARRVGVRSPQRPPDAGRADRARRLFGRRLRPHGAVGRRHAGHQLLVARRAVRRAQRGGPLAAAAGRLTRSAQASRSSITAPTTPTASSSASASITSGGAMR